METSTGFEHLHHTSFGIGEVGGVKYFWVLPSTNLPLACVYATLPIPLFLIFTSTAGFDSFSSHSMEPLAFLTPLQIALASLSPIDLSYHKTSFLYIIFLIHSFTFYYQLKLHIYQYYIYLSLLFIFQYSHHFYFFFKYTKSSEIGINIRNKVLIADLGVAQLRRTGFDVKLFFWSEILIFPRIYFSLFFLLAVVETCACYFVLFVN